MPQDALQSVLTETALAIAPLRTINTPERAAEFFRQMGYDLSTSVFGTALPQLGSQAVEIINSVQRLSAADGEEEIASAVIELFGRINATIDIIGELHTQITSGGGGAIPNIDQLPRRLVDFLILDYLHKQRTELHEVLFLFGLIEHNTAPSEGASTRLVNWDRFGQFLTDPGRIADEEYQWSTDFDAAEFLMRMERLMRAVPLPGGIYPQANTTRTLLSNTATDLQELRFPIFQKGFTPETYSQFGITFSPAEARGAEKKGIALLPYIMGAAEFQFDVCDRGEIVFESSADIKGIGLTIRPPFEIDGILDLTGAYRALIGIREKSDRADEIILIGSAGGTRLSVQGLGINWFIQNPQQELDIGFEGEIQALRLVVAGGESDGFLQQVLSGLNIQAEASLALGMTLKNGFTFRGGAKLALELSTHIDLGPLEIQSLRLALEPTAEKLNVEAGAVLKLELGPLKAAVENIGIRSDIEFRQGNLGPANLVLGFKPPNGVGLSVDAGAVKGGGYLFFDFDREEYAGALELVFSEWITLKAIGLITTKMPDGSKGFSLLVIITAEFGTGFQLGFGFTLDGVGGILGLNRIVNVDPLKDGIRTGAIESVMFPENVVANAPRIISDLRQFFPPHQNIFLVGPMAKIGWGTPTLVTAKLGVILEFPSVNITILGVIKVVLPDEEADVLRLQVNFIGRLEPSNKLLWFYAELFDSRVLFITLEGGFGLLVNWGDNANFVVSVGGFHPKYNPPPLPFPEPPRIAANILNESYAKVRIEAYFAVTSNSVQFGARAELYFGVSEFRIEGHLAFDALFLFDPFFFSFGLSVSLSVKVFGVGLFSVGFSGLLEGPTPWHMEGKGKISILFFKISVPFKHTWGDNQDTKLDPIEIFPLLETEFDALTNWEAKLPTSSNLLVSLRKMGEADTDQLVLHPVGKLRVSQRKIPINFTLEKVGNNRPSDVNNIVVDAELPGAGGLSVSSVEEKFAIGQFKDLDGSSQLSSPGFEPLESGIEIAVAGEQMKTSRAVRRVIRYESIIIDNNFKRHVKRFFGFFAAGYAILNDFLFTHFLTGNAVTQSAHSQHHKNRMQPFSEVIKVKPSLYSVASTTDNRPLDTAATAFTSQAKAQEHMDQQIQTGAASANDLHVVPNTELNIAA